MITAKSKVSDFEFSYLIECLYFFKNNENVCPLIEQVKLIFLFR